MVYRTLRRRAIPRLHSVRLFQRVWAKVKRSGFGNDWPAHQRQYSVLHLFDHDGRHQSSDIWYAGTGRDEPIERPSHACRSASTPYLVESTATSSSGCSGSISMIRCSGSSTSPRSWDSTSLCFIQTIGASARHGTAAMTPNQDDDGLWDRNAGNDLRPKRALGHIGATNDRNAADNTGHYPSRLEQLTGQIRQDNAGHPTTPVLSRTEESSSRPGRGEWPPAAAVLGRHALRAASPAE
jgi:hypothetical protein